MLGFVGDVGSEVASDDAVPGGVVLLVELLLDVGGDVLLDVVFLQRLGRAVDGVLLHLLRHVRVLEHRLRLLLLASLAVPTALVHNHSRPRLEAVAEVVEDLRSKCV